MKDEHERDHLDQRRAAQRDMTITIPSSAQRQEEQRRPWPSLHRCAISVGLPHGVPWAAKEVFRPGQHDHAISLPGGPRTPDERTARSLLGLLRFAGERRLVDRSEPRKQFTSAGDHVAGSHSHDVPGTILPCRMTPARIAPDARTHLQSPAQGLDDAGGPRSCIKLTTALTTKRVLTTASPGIPETADKP